MRERGNVSPLIAVAIGAILVAFVLPLMIHRQRSGQMATVVAYVSIGDNGSNQTPSSNIPRYRWPDSEVPRTADRLRDVTAVAIASMTYVVEGAMGGRAPHDAGEILVGIARRDLIPKEWLTNQSGVLQMPNGTVHLRYSPARARIEALSVPNDRVDGPAILIRLPDRENTTVGARYLSQCNSMELSIPVRSRLYLKSSLVVGSNAYLSKHNYLIRKECSLNNGLSIQLATKNSLGPHYELSCQS